VAHGKGSRGLCVGLEGGPYSFPRRFRTDQDVVFRCRRRCLAHALGLGLEVGMELGEGDVLFEGLADSGFGVFGQRRD